MSLLYAFNKEPMTPVRNHIQIDMRSAKITKAFITGAAGFIGSSLVDRLLSDGLDVVGWDNLSTGQERFLRDALKHPNFKLIRGDNLDLAGLKLAMQGCDFVFHLAANADIKDGWKHPEKDLQQNTIATFNVLEAMRANGVRRIGFSSTGSVYGEALVTTDKPTPENDGFPIQTSLYAASKIAGEALISSYAEGGQIDEAYIFRFVSILGERYTHGHVFDFYRQLLEHPDWLRVLGNGKQRKSYLYVHDCVEAICHVTMLGAARTAKHHTAVYNLGTPEYVEVAQSIRYICKVLGLNPRIELTGGERGWIGDNPFIFLDTKKIQSTGWRPKLTIEQGIVRTLQWLQTNRWVFESRG
jgi:UDP-glucose 4-epimerase